MSQKMALFAFNGEAMCFMHVLLNALNLHEKGFEAKVVVEGAATKLVPEFGKAESPLYRLYEKARAANLIEGACRACCAKMGTAQAAEELDIRLLDDMMGHPSMSRYFLEGYQVITF
ncbi:MAG: cytoplasmic protein [Syntrophobacteraceae bacterium]